MLSRAHIVCGDVFDVLSKLEPVRFDGALLDPPYGLNFMGRAFDRQHKLKPGANDGQRLQAWNLDWLELVYPLLKPGASLVAASASKLYHRLACPAEDAGFDVQPLFAWINGQAMAQSGNISKLIDKAAGAEREVVGSKLGRPGMSKDGTNQRRESASSLDHGRIGEVYSSDITAPSTPLARLFHGYGSRLKDSVCPWLFARRPPDNSRWTVELTPELLDQWEAQRAAAVEG